MNPVLKSVIINICLLIVLLFVFYWSGQPEIVCLINSGNIPKIITCSGILWFIGSFVSIGRSPGAYYINILSSIACVLFGLGLSTIGIFGALIELGAYLLILVWAFGSCSEQTTTSTTIAIIGIFLIIIGVVFRGCNTPLEKPPVSDDVLGDCSEADWDITSMANYDILYVVHGPTSFADKVVEQLKNKGYDVKKSLYYVPVERAKEFGRLDMVKNYSGNDPLAKAVEEADRARHPIPSIFY